MRVCVCVGGGGVETGMTNICLRLLLPTPASGALAPGRGGGGGGAGCKVEKGMCLDLLSSLALSSRQAADVVRPQHRPHIPLPCPCPHMYAGTCPCPHMYAREVRRVMI